MFLLSGLQALAELEHPIARHIIEYRQIKKLMADLDSYCSTRDTRRASGGSNGSVRRYSPVNYQEPLSGAQQCHCQDAFLVSFLIHGAAPNNRGLLAARPMLGLWSSIAASEVVHCLHTLQGIVSGTLESCLERQLVPKQCRESQHLGNAPH